MNRQFLVDEAPDGTREIAHFDSDGNLAALHWSADVEPVIDSNKRAQTDGTRGYGDTRELQKIASIPVAVLMEYCQVHGISLAQAMGGPGQMEVIKRILATGLSLSADRQMKLVTLDDVDLIDRGLETLDDTIRQGELAHRNKALFLLSEGRLREGWAAYAHRLRCDAQITYDRFPVPRWNGESLARRHVLVWFEQGVGDQIFGAGMLPDLIRVAASVTVFCCRRLAPVLRRSFPDVDVHRVGDPVAPRLAAWDFDCQMSIGDLGLAFRAAWGDFSARPYLAADPRRVRMLRRKYRRYGARVVGVAWRSGNKDHGAAKSIPLAELMPALRARNTVYVSLQYGSRETASALLTDPSIDPLLDVEGAVAQVEACDTIMTVSTTVAHIAGALGKPAKVLLSRGAGRLWYWHAERSDSPWYPSLRLLRQDVPGSWENVVRALTDAECAA